MILGESFDDGIMILNILDFDAPMSKMMMLLNTAIIRRQRVQFNPLHGDLVILIEMGLIDLFEGLRMEDSEEE